MDSAYILDKQFNTVGIVDRYKSLIWTKRYQDAGDFELYIQATPENILLLREDNYIMRPDDDMVCVIDTIQLTTDEDSGDFLIVTGKSLESLLARRVVWSQTTLSGTAEAGIRKLITENAISPSMTSRKIPHLVLESLHGYTETIQKQITGENLLEAIKAICVSYGYGFRITLNEEREMVCQVYKGVDRSTNQSQAPFVIFSPQYDNILSSAYSYSKAALKNVALVAGEGEGKNRKTKVVGTATGLNRYEIFVDARNTSSNDGEISDEEYAELLAEQGNEAISEATETEEFSGEVETTMLYQYKQHWDLGDIVQVSNGYGIESSPRITEIIECRDENGYSCIPTFSTWEVE